MGRILLGFILLSEYIHMHYKEPFYYLVILGGTCRLFSWYVWFLPLIHIIGKNIFSYDFKIFTWVVVFNYQHCCLMFRELVCAVLDNLSKELQYTSRMKVIDVLLKGSLVLLFFLYISSLHLNEGNWCFYHIYSCLHLTLCNDFSWDCNYLC